MLASVIRRDARPELYVKGATVDVNFEIRHCSVYNRRITIPLECHRLDGEPHTG